MCSGRCGRAVVVFFDALDLAADGGVQNTIRWLGIGLILNWIIGGRGASLYIVSNKSWDS